MSLWRGQRVLIGILLSERKILMTDALNSKNITIKISWKFPGLNVFLCTSWTGVHDPKQLRVNLSWIQRKNDEFLRLWDEIHSTEVLCRWKLWRSIAVVFSHRGCLWVKIQSRQGPSASEPWLLVAVIKTSNFGKQDKSDCSFEEVATSKDVTLMSPYLDC